MNKFYNLFEALFFNILASLLAFILTVFLGKNLSVADYGNFSTALFIILLVSPLVGFGLPKFILSEFGKYGVNAKQWLDPSFSFVKNSLILVISFIFFISIFFINKSVLAFYVIVLIPVLINQVLIEFLSLKYQLERNFKKVAFINAFSSILKLIFLLIIFLTVGLDINNVLLAFSLSSILLLLFSLKQVYSFKKGEINYHFDYISVEDDNKINTDFIIKKSWPFGIMGISYLIFFQINILLVNFLEGARISGLYAAAFVFINMVYIFPSILYQKILLPKIHYVSHHNHNEFKKIYMFGNLSMLLMGGVVGSLIYIFSKELIDFFYGEKYVEAIEILKFLSFAVPFRFLSNSLGSVLSTRNSMITKVKIMSFMSLLSLISGYVFISSYGVYGAIFVTVLCEFLLMLLYYIQTKLYFKKGSALL